MPPDTVVVARPTRWGNTWKIGDVIEPDVTRGGTVKVTSGADVVDLFRLKVDSMKPDRREAFLAPLRGKNVACWCHLCDKHSKGKPPRVHCADCDPCHADVLLDEANP